MKINNNRIFKQLAKINICYYKDSRYFDNNVILRLNDKDRFLYNLDKYSADIQDRIIDDTNNYFFMTDCNLKKYIYLPVVKLLFYFCLTALEQNSATITIYNQNLLKVFNIEERTLREYYFRLSLIMPNLYYRYFDNLKQKDALFCNIDFSNKSDYIVISFDSNIFYNHIKAAQNIINFDSLIFNNRKFNSKYANKAFYIYLAYIFNEKLDFTKLVNSCYEHLEQIEKAQSKARYIKRQIYNPIVSAVNNLLFYKLLKIKQNSNTIFDIVFCDGYINEDNLYFIALQMEQYFKATKLRAYKNHLSEWREIHNLKKQDFIIAYENLFNLLYIS